MRADKAPLHWEFAHVIYSVRCMRANHVPPQREVAYVVYAFRDVRADDVQELFSCDVYGSRYSGMCVLLFLCGQKCDEDGVLC